MVNDLHVDQYLNNKMVSFVIHTGYEVEGIATTAEKINLHNALTRVMYFFCMNPK